MLENLLLGLQITAIGLIVVFAILVLLIVALQLFEKFLYKKSSLQDAEPEAVQPVQPQIAVSQDVNADAAVVAAITASLAVILGQSQQSAANSRVSFVVRSIKKF